MPNSKIILVAAMAVLVAPGFSVESMYLDTMPVSNPGEYLAPANFYLNVPLPFIPAGTLANSLAPATVYDQGIVNTAIAASGSSGYSGYVFVSSEEDAEASDLVLRVFLKSGLDNASDVPLSVIREHFSDIDGIELVDDGDAYDVMVEVETMKLATGTVFIVINAYKDVEDESLIFYNNFGYLGEDKVMSGSVSFADNLESALNAETEQLGE